MREPLRFHPSASSNVNNEAFNSNVAQVLFTNPLEIVKIRLQVQGETEAM